ncbi:MAG: hypothetical protein ACI31D_04725, partial [Candidatus Limisoma sp.]
WQDLYIPSGSRILLDGGSLTITGKLTFQSSCILEVLFGSSISGSGTLVGESAQFIAPIMNLFSENLSIEGIWIMEKAYPQWFGATAYNSIDALTNDSVCSAVAITKAAAFKGKGIVFLHKGAYLIKNSIELLDGICLAGESHDVEDAQLGTILCSDIDNREMSNKKYIIRANVNDNGQANVTFRKNITKISNLAIVKKEHPNNQNGIINNQYGIITGSPIEVDHVLFSRLAQAIKFLNNYIDLKSIHDCVYQSSRQYSNDEDSYAFDFGGLGDALLFQHNAIHSTSYNKAIRLANCGGGEISANIINSNVYIINCKGISLRSNHLEKGSIVKLERSCASLSNNYFWIGEEPVLQIIGTKSYDMSFISSNNDTFVFYDTDHYKISNEAITNDVLKTPYEISIDQFSIINLHNLKRCSHRANNFGVIYPCGIAIEKTEFTFHSNGTVSIQNAPLNSFNNYSYGLSSNCTIGPNYKITAFFKNNKLQTQPFDVGIMQNSDVIWLNDDNTNKTYYYKYKFQIFYDKTRQIVQGGVNFLKDVKYRSSDGYFSAAHQGPGALIILINYNENYMLRLVRYKYDQTPTNDNSSSSNLIKTEFVDIPIHSAKYLYDNGISICGYEWKDATNENLLISGDSNIESFEYHNESFQAIVGTSFSNSNNWETGDIIFKTDNTIIIK